MGEIFSPMGGGSNFPGMDSDLPERGLTKRIYKPPRLCSYGTLRDITSSNKHTFGQDNSGNENHKTRL